MAEKICCIVYSKVNGDFKFLLLHKNNWWNGWEFVRGEVDSGESPIGAAKREAMEETGLFFEKVISIPFNYSYDYLKGLNFIESNVSCFFAKANDSAVRLSEEHDYFKWADYDDAMKLLDFDEQKRLLDFFKKSFM